ncbi:MAG: phage virion morphogenesis protein [Treponemataceae bacterium]|nr:phage virion morphogenesis protein [Treponemataceae bacterium]
MGVVIIKSLPEFARRIKNADLEPVMEHLSRVLVSSAQKKIHRGVPPENAPLTQEVKRGNKTLRDTGLLWNSIAPHHGKKWASAGTNLAYARIQQKGGTVVGRGRGLWIPAGAKTRRLMRQHNAQTPGELIGALRGAGYSFFSTKKAFCAKSKRGKPFALFIIKRSVKIPARPFLYIDDEDERLINREIRRAVHEALGGGK